MPVALIVKCDDAEVKANREAAAQRVIDYVASNLPDTRVLCFLDDEDPHSLRCTFGQANRGLSGNVHDNSRIEGWPEYVWKYVFLEDPISWRSDRGVDDLVYLYGTCSENTGMTMTLAHELQHVVQHANNREEWALNSLVSRCAAAINDLKLEWADIPIERDARIVAKRVALQICGEQAVAEYVADKLTNAVDAHDIADWQFVSAVNPADSVGLRDSTRLLFRRLKPHRIEIVNALQCCSDNPKFSGIDLDSFFESLAE